jgi:HEAT repeat protein
LIYVSYHNIDIAYAFQLSNLLIRYYRNVWLDRFEIDLNEDWSAMIREARARATGVIVVVTDDYLESNYCRAEFEYFQSRGIAITAVIPRDFSTEMIADFTFSDWIDFRRWFDDPNDHSVDNLLSQIPQSEAVEKTGERLDYLRSFIQDVELALAKMPTSWVSLRNSAALGTEETRPRMFQPNMARGWDFSGHKAGNTLPVNDLLEWSQGEPQFIIRGEAGSGKTYFARLLALQQAHAAIRDGGEAIPAWLDLALWDQSHRSFGSFIESQWTLLTHWQHWLDEQQTLFVLDNWSDFASSQPAQASELTHWIDASPEHRFIVLSGFAARIEPNLPAIQINRITPALAQSFASGCLTLDQQNSFRQLLKQKNALIENEQVDSLSIGIELLSADRALAFNQWHQNPLPALIALRGQQMPSVNGGLDAKRILTDLQALAWSMMLQNNHRFLRRDSIIGQSIDPRVIDRALEIGLLEEAGAKLRFQSEMIQQHLAVEALKKDGLSKYLTRPEFAAGRGRIPKKWDNLAIVLVNGLAEEKRLQVIDQIADIEPFVAAMCLQRRPELYGNYQETLITKLAQLCAQNPAAQRAFRSLIKDLPSAEQTAELLISQLGRFGNAQQLWLWLEVRTLPLELPLDLIRLVEDVDRESRLPITDRLEPYSLSRALAYLVKLSVHQDETIRRNAIWMLGEIKYLPTAILLLDDLERGEGKDHGEVVLALMKFAYSDLLVRVLRWSQEHPVHRPAVIRALADRKRRVTSRLLALADARRLTLNPEFYDVVINTDETDIAIGMAQIAAQSVDLPDSLMTAIHSKSNADELRARLAQSIKHLPNREGFQQLLGDISDVLSDPPEPTIVAGSNIEALVYGQPLFDDMSAQAEAAPSSALPAELLDQLSNEDWQQRHLALYRLADYSAIDALPPLLEAVHAENTRVRLAAYETLARFESELPARKAVIAALSDPDLAVVAAVAELLKTMTSVDYDALVDLLDSENPTTVAAVIDVLGSAQHQPATAALGQLLDDTRMAANRGVTIGQLARQARQAIESSVLDGDKFREAPATNPDLASDSASTAFSDEEKIIRTLEVLRDDDWGRTQKAAKFLRKFARHLRGSENPQIVKLLCDSLQDENWSVRWAAAEALAMLRNPTAIPALSAGLKDPSWIVQVAVVRALVELEAQGLAANMTPLLQSPRTAVREATAEALGDMGDPLAIPTLGELLKHDADEFVRFAALRAINQIDPSGARPHLELALSDSSIHLRWFAMRRLGPKMNETDLPILKQLLNDHDKPSWENESLHELAILTLQRIGSAECRALLESVALAEKRIDG